MFRLLHCNKRGTSGIDGVSGRSQPNKVNKYSTWWHGTWDLWRRPVPLLGFDDQWVHEFCSRSPVHCDYPSELGFAVDPSAPLWSAPTASDTLLKPCCLRRKFFFFKSCVRERNTSDKTVLSLLNIFPAAWKLNGWSFNQNLKWKQKL